MNDQTEPRLPVRVLTDEEFDTLERSPDKVYVISVHAAMRKLGVSRAYIYKLVNHGKLPKPFRRFGAKKGSEAYFFEADLDAVFYDGVRDVQDQFTDSPRLKRLEASA